MEENGEVKNDLISPKPDFLSQLLERHGLALMFECAIQGRQQALRVLWAAQQVCCFGQALEFAGGDHGDGFLTAPFNDDDFAVFGGGIHQAGEFGSGLGVGSFDHA